MTRLISALGFRYPTAPGVEDGITGDIRFCDMNPKIEEKKEWRNADASELYSVFMNRMIAQIAVELYELIALNLVTIVNAYEFLVSAVVE